MGGYPTPMSLAVFSGATVDMPKVLLCTRAKAAAGGEHNRDVIVLKNSEEPGASAPFALTCAEEAQDRARSSQGTRPRDRGLSDGHAIYLKRNSFVRLAVEVYHIAIAMPRGARKRLEKRSWMRPSTNSKCPATSRGYSPCAEHTNRKGGNSFLADCEKSGEENNRPTQANIKRSAQLPLCFEEGSTQNY